MATLLGHDVPTVRKPGLILLVLTAIALAACDSKLEETGPTQSTSFSLDKNNVDHANIQLDLKAGELKLSGGTNKLVDGQFEFNVASSKPITRSSIDGSHASVTIEQPRNIEFGNHARNTWDLQLNDQAVLDLALNCGAGKADMNLGSLNLRSLQVHMGAGQVNLDLSGHPQHDYEVEMAGGVGQATIRLPQGVGIRADVTGGLGNIDVKGLEKKGDHYENDSFDTAKVNVRLKVTGGIGEIRILD